MAGSLTASATASASVASVTQEETRSSATVAAAADVSRAAIAAWAAASAAWAAEAGSPRMAASGSSSAWKVTRLDCDTRRPFTRFVVVAVDWFDSQEARNPLICSSVKPASSASWTAAACSVAAV